MTQVAPDIWVIDNTLSPEVCSSIIERFETDQTKRPGSVGDGDVNQTVKDSLDLSINKKDPEWTKDDTALHDSLHTSMGEIVRELTWYTGHQPQHFNFDTGHQIQKTVPGGKYVWHVETDGTSRKDRTLVYAWYLNEGFEGGCTGFARQGVKVEPKIGRLVLFSPYWTHVHAGLPLLSGEKYLITGWIHANEVKL